MALLSACILLFASWFTEKWQHKLWNEARQHRPEVRVRDLSESLGQGMILGVLGGFRSIIADFLFIRSYVYWEERELTKMQTTYELALSIDPRSLGLWLNGSRIIAYDAPVWRIQELQALREVSPLEAAAIHAEQANVALGFITRAEQFHPGDYRIPLEQAQIYMHKLEDYSTASAYFLKGSEMEGAPYYMGRLHAELLRRMGRQQEAYEYLKGIYPRLPDDDAAAAKSVVFERIQALETELGALPTDTHE